MAGRFGSIESAEHDSELGRWQTVQRAADPRLRAYVHGYLASSSALRVPVLERHVPSTEVPLLINFGEPHRHRGIADADWVSHDGAWIVGLHTHRQFTHALGERHFMVVRFTPLGAHRFLRLPMHSIANAAVDLARIDAALARALVSRVGRARSWADRFAAVEALIAQRLADTTRDDAATAVAYVWRALESAGGNVALGALAAEVGCSRRTLIARFKTNVGVAPKTVARLLRFNRVVHALDRASRTRANETAGKPYIELAIDSSGASRHALARLDRSVGREGRGIRWADLAIDCGYFDQAHLIKDFRAFAGDTPEAFLRRVSDAA